ncbi:Uncharacterized protein dnm_045720 [Desulfonema magnum]|uniref:Uncharacterized protein n=1 Tax=Desulfonema magnum TaxID=45655 RepID=A0A975GP10_9BACT|nr:Uncharacterized protein dnm_045720 [Desulfonema magnum]
MKKFSGPGGEDGADGEETRFFRQRGTLCPGKKPGFLRSSAHSPKIFRSAECRKLHCHITGVLHMPFHDFYRENIF